MATVSCSNCSGSGQLRCIGAACIGGYVTSGGERRLCLYCNGNSFTPCSNCNGRGSWFSPDSDPPASRDYGYTPPSSCTHPNSSGGIPDWLLSRGFPRLTGTLPREGLNPDCAICKKSIPVSQREVYFIPRDDQDHLLFGFSYGTGGVLCLECGEPILNRHFRWRMKRLFASLTFSVVVIISISGFVWINFFKR